MEKNITVDKLISEININSYTKEKEIKEAFKKIKIKNYDSALVNAIANQVVLNSHIKDEIFWLDSNKEEYLMNMAFINNFTNIDISNDVLEYDFLVNYGLMDEIKNNKSYCLFKEAVINSRNDLIKNNENSYHKTIEIFITIASKVIDAFLNSENEIIKNINLNNLNNDLNDYSNGEE